MEESDKVRIGLVRHAARWSNRQTPVSASARSCMEASPAAAGGIFVGGTASDLCARNGAMSWRLCYCSYLERPGRLRKLMEPESSLDLAEK